MWRGNEDYSCTRDVMTEKFIKSDPYAWPYNGDLRPQNTALIVIDMQTDFCGKGDTSTCSAMTSPSHASASSRFARAWRNA